MAWLSGWSKRIAITVSNSNIDSDLTHFPLLLLLGTSVGTGSDDISCIFDEVGSDSKKIAVTKSDGTTEIYAEVEKWDNGNEKAVLWVSKSDLVLFKDSNTTLYIYYDNTQDDNSSYVGDVGSRTEVWNSNYKIVYHLKESAGSAIDSTGGFDKAYLGSLPDEVDGKIGYGQDFDGAGDYIDVGEHASLNPVTFTVQAWVNPDSFTSDDWKGYLASKEGANAGWALRIGDAYPNFMVGDGDATPQAKSSTKISAGTWYLITGVYDGDYIKVYENYTEKDSVSSGSYSITISSLFVGEYIWGSRAVDGQLDEFRYSDIARSAAWIKVDYYAQDDNLVSYGGEELRVNQTITAKASIFNTQIQTITAKGNVGTGFETKTQTITAKAKIVCVTQTELVTPSSLSIETTPVYFVWEIPVCCKERNIHAHVQIDKTDDTFGDLEKDLFSYRDSDFEYWDGGTWQTYPTTGVTSAYYGNQARVQVSLTNGNKWWRARGGVK